MKQSNDVLLYFQHGAPDTRISDQLLLGKLMQALVTLNNLFKQQKYQNLFVLP